MPVLQSIVTFAEAADFCGALRKLKPFMATEMARPVLNSILAEYKNDQMLFVATQGTIIGKFDATEKLSNDDPFPVDFSAIIPTGAVNHLIKLLPKKKSKIPVPLTIEVIGPEPIGETLGAKPGRIRVSWGIPAYEYDLFLEEYPDWRRVWPEVSENAQRATFNPGLLATVLKEIDSPSVNLEGDGATSPFIITPTSPEEKLTCVIMTMRG